MKNIVSWYRCKSEKFIHAMSVIYAVGLIVGMVGGGFSLGVIVAWHYADTSITKLRKDYRDSLDLIKFELSVAARTNAETAKKIDETARTARDAAKRAQDAVNTIESTISNEQPN